MEVRIQIPDDVAAQIQTDGGDLPRNVLEAYALEGYKSGQLSANQVQEILGFETLMEVDGFLKSHGVYLVYTEEALEEVLATSRRVSSQHRASKCKSHSKSIQKSPSCLPLKQAREDSRLKTI